MKDGSRRRRLSL